MVEPVYIAQTFAEENTATTRARSTWWETQLAEAGKVGGVHARCSMISNGKGLLLESWDRNVTEQEQGMPRWAPEKAE